MLDLPKIRLELESMRYSVIHAFSNHNDEIEKVVNQQLKEAIETYPFKEKITQEANTVINQVIEATVRDYFAYGQGREAIEQVTLQALGGLTINKADKGEAGENSEPAS